jgi:hypothetical protein
MAVLPFLDWLVENATENQIKRPLRKLEDLSINREYKGTRYEAELFPRFRRLKARIQQMDKMPNLQDWFILMQNSDAEFYTLVQTGELGQPDVRELFRDLTNRRAAKMKKYNL